MKLSNPMCRIISFCFFSLGFIFFSGCKEKEGEKLTIYTSMYKEVIELYKPELKKAFPNLEIEWFQAGSENVASRVMAELQGGGTKADILFTSDIFFFQELKKMGLLLPLTAVSNLSKLDPSYVDADKTYAVTRFPVMVIAINTRKIAPADRPKSFKDLLNAKYKDKLTMPSPLESGTALASSLYFYNTLGQTYFEGLRKNNIVASGGNGAVLSRVKSGEKPVAIVLMENVLQAREKGDDWIEFIIPEEGALAIPSPIAIFKSSKKSDLSQKVFDWLLTDAAQEVLVKGWIYSPFPHAPAPNGAPAWSALKMYPWSLSSLEKWGEDRQKVKDLFQNIVLK
jgi:iron(III) transport system substrate-binding protein